MEKFKIIYQLKSGFHFTICTVSNSTKWYLEDQRKRPDYWDNEIFIADV